MQKMHATLLMAGLMACTALQAQWKKITGNGNTITQERSLSAFSEISVAGGMQVTITQAGNTSVKVQADDNLMEYIITEIKGNKLVVKYPNNVSINSKGVKILVSIPKLDGASISGSGNIICASEMPSSGSFNASISGSGNIDVKTTASKVSASISGSGNIQLGGKTKELEVAISGSGSFKGYELKTEDAQVKISGSGNVETTATAKLDAVISGSGDIYYKGNPGLSLKSAGSGKIKKTD
jgi:hypothetical protein